jgi:hypothetical protein
MCVCVRGGGGAGVHLWLWCAMGWLSACGCGVLLQVLLVNNGLTPMDLTLTFADVPGVASGLRHHTRAPLHTRYLQLALNATPHTCRRKGRYLCVHGTLPTLPSSLVQVPPWRCVTSGTTRTSASLRGRTPRPRWARRTLRPKGQLFALCVCGGDGGRWAVGGGRRAAGVGAGPFRAMSWPCLWHVRVCVVHVCCVCGLCV